MLLLLALLASPRFNENRYLDNEFTNFVLLGVYRVILSGGEAEVEGSPNTKSEHRKTKFREGLSPDISKPRRPLDLFVLKDNKRAVA